MSYPEPSIYDHGAEWNLDDDGNRCCAQCQRKRKAEDVDDYEYHYRRDER
jgi:hypothetical protein